MESQGITAESWRTLHDEGRAHAERGSFDEAIKALRRAARVATDNGESGALASVYGDLGEVLVEKGELDDGIEALKEALSLSQASQDLLAMATQCRRLGVAYREKGDYDRALDEFRAAEGFLRRVDDEREWALLHTALGQLDEERGKHHRALASYQKALAINQALEAVDGVVTSLRHVASALQEIGDLDDAAEHLRRALALVEAERRNDRPELIELHNQLGSVIEDQGQPVEALRHYEEALELADEIGHELGRAESLRHMGSAHASRGEFDRAATCYQQSIRIARSFDDEVALSELFGDLGDVLLAMGETNEALEAFRNALSRDQAHQDVLGMAVQHRRLGTAYTEFGDYDRAADAFDEADQLLRQIDDDGEKAILFSHRGVLHEAEGNYEKALKVYARALAIDEAQRNDVGVVICLRRTASAQIALGRFDAAAENVRRAIAILEEESVEEPLELIEANNLLGQVLIEQGAVVEARRIFEQSLDAARDLEIEPMEAETLQLAARAYAAGGETQAAQEALDHARRIWEHLEDEVALANLCGLAGEVLETEGKTNEAIRQYTSGLRIARRRDLRPVIARLGVGLARCCRRLRELNRMADVLEEIQETIDVGRSPLRGDIWAELGRLAEMRERYQDAADHYEMALDFFKQTGRSARAIECHRLLVNVWLIRGDTEKATSALFEALTLSPGDEELAWELLLSQLDARIVEAAAPAFQAHEYESALHMAFRTCETELRARAGGDDAREQASAVIQRWFTPEERGLAPWVDGKELAAFGSLWTGAFGACRNPQAHRAVPLRAVDAFAWLATTHLMISLLDAPAD